MEITLELVHHLSNTGWRQICFYRYCELADYNHNNSWLPPTVTQPMNLTTFSWPSLPKSFNNSISLSRAFLPFSPEIARKPRKIKYTKKNLHVMRDTIVYVVNIHFCKYCILGVKLSAQITMHLVCIRQIKFRFLNPIKSILIENPEQLLSSGKLIEPRNYFTDNSQK